MDFITILIAELCNSEIGTSYDKEGYKLLVELLSEELQNEQDYDKKLSHLSKTLFEIEDKIWQVTK